MKLACVKTVLDEREEAAKKEAKRKNGGEEAQVPRAPRGDAAEDICTFLNVLRAEYG